MQTGSQKRSDRQQETIRYLYYDCGRCKLNWPEDGNLRSSLHPHALRFQKLPKGRVALNGRTDAAKGNLLRWFVSYNVKYILRGGILCRSRISYLKVHCSKALASSFDLSIEAGGARLKVIKDKYHIVQQIRLISFYFRSW